ncbi:3-methyl-2-oxobutanoate hydroxymethyltransferase [Devosia chinhatensis]|uniref:3-methyl-2-oxobutanoate hydroxymethyltransferase n=1 Tax=Devosia chinhatensis TaxID=429727 RepID=A0A0F5FFL3_9HYPH|nr:3-methyl-2-oxobutanoate hydroxymethyltransferase [Devosia chinhatensis]KKB07636.1 3-methyl-2-oxobutanoate hydroxymethyltransferase [Devosia chinhatensis]
MSAQTPSKRLTTRDISAMRQRGEAIAMLTAYDATMASLVESAGVDMILIGDSLGNVVLGHETTLPVTLDDMIRHASAVKRGSRRALLVCDMPFGSVTDPQIAVQNAVRVMKETGVEAVKIEGGLAVVPMVEMLVAQGIAVMAHIGLMPQSVHQMGGYYMHGKDEASAARLRAEAKALEAAGAFAIVLECVTPALAADITRALTIPTIGIGSGKDCAGQVLVVNDLIGLSVTPPPSFAKPRADVAAIIRAAVGDYVADTKAERQPIPMPRRAE